MRRSTLYRLSSAVFALVLMLTTLVGSAMATTPQRGAPAAAPVPAAAAGQGTICVVKFNDLDGDGKQGPNEPALTGWVFTIKDANGNVVGVIGTAAGVPRCIDLPPGTYTVTEQTQNGWTPTTAGGATQTVTVVAGQTTTVTFGNHEGQVPPGRICIVKFNDLDGDGKQGPNEPTLFGWVFTIKDANGNVVGTITTVAGTPNCINLPPGTYTVTETVQPGWTPTTPGGATQTVTVVSGQTTTVTFGNHQQPEKGRLCIVKFNDLDGDGKQGPNEPTLFGWVFTIKDSSGNVVGTITTGDLVPNCIDLPPGTYTVTETVQPGWTPTTPGGATQTVTVVAGQTTTVTFGNRQGSRICVVKFEDLNGNGKQDPGEPLLNNWVFTVKNSANVVVGTLVSGTSKRCIDVPPGTYTVTETLQAGWLPTTPGGVTQTVVVPPGQTVIVIFGNHRCCLTFTFLGGKIDNFSVSNGATAEPVTPPVITAPPAYFDATKGDRAFAHRFYLGMGNCIQSATLEIKIKALPGGSTNDTLGIKVPGSSSWAKPISAIAPTGTWTPPKVKTVLFNLGAMPSGGGSSNLIPALNTIRVLDINIQDDTSVDYIKLIVVFCECSPTHN